MAIGTLSDEEVAAIIAEQQADNRRAIRLFASEQPMLVNGHTIPDASGDGPPAAEIEIFSHASLDWRALEGQEPPPRAWVIPDWIPASHVTLLAGKGGVGKTLLAQHIATVVAKGLPGLLGPMEPRRVLMWAGEDDARELWWRQIVMCSYFHLKLSDLAENFKLHSYSGVDMTLATTEYGALVPTIGLEALRRQVEQFKPELVILDNIARLYGGNENARHDVTTFVAWVQSACAPAAVLLLGHPAKSVDSEYSGSTAWEGAVRSRLYLSDKPPDAAEDDDDAPLANDRTRFLSRRKANYSDTDVKQFSLIEGSLIPVEAEGTGLRNFHSDSEIARSIVRQAIERLATQEMFGVAATGSPNYLPRLAKQFGQLGPLAVPQFTAVMRGMMLAGLLKRGQVGTYPNRSPRFGLVCGK